MKLFGTAAREFNTLCCSEAEVTHSAMVLCMNFDFPQQHGICHSWNHLRLRQMVKCCIRLCFNNWNRGFQVFCAAAKAPCVHLHAVTVVSKEKHSVMYSHSTQAQLSALKPINLIFFPLFFLAFSWH